MVLLDGFAEGPLGCTDGVIEEAGIDESGGGFAADRAGGHPVDPIGGGFGLGQGPVAKEGIDGSGFALIVGHAFDPIGGSQRVLSAPKGDAVVEGFATGNATGVFLDPKEGRLGVFGGPDGDDFEHAPEAITRRGFGEEPLHGGFGIGRGADPGFSDEGVCRCFLRNVCDRRRVVFCNRWKDQGGPCIGGCRHFFFGGALANNLPGADEVLIGLYQGGSIGECGEGEKANDEEEPESTEEPAHGGSIEPVKGTGVFGGLSG